MELLRRLDFEQPKKKKKKIEKELQQEEEYKDTVEVFHE